MRELGGAPLDVAAAATGTAAAFAAVGAVTLALRRRPAAFARDSDDDTRVDDAEFDRDVRGRGSRDGGTAGANVSVALAPFFVLLVIAAACLLVEHLRRGGWGASPLDPTDVRGAISAIERSVPPLKRADVRQHCARMNPPPGLFHAHGHPNGVPDSVNAGGLRLGIDVAGATDENQKRLQQAEQHFKLGLLLKFGFNADEARRHFLLAARLATDAKKDCAACLWGVAYSLHPDVNNWRTHKEQRAAGRVAAAAAVALAAKDVAAARRRYAELAGDTGKNAEHDRLKVANALKLLVLAEAEAAFFGTNVFHHPPGSATEDSFDVFGDQDDEPAQIDAHARYLRVMETGINSLLVSGDEEGIDVLTPDEASNATSTSTSSYQSTKQKEYSSRSRRATLVDDPDLLAFLGVARMTLTPWRYWDWTVPNSERTIDKTTDGTTEGTSNQSGLAIEVREYHGAESEGAFLALQRALRLDKSHPLAAHAMVHLTEALPLRNLGVGVTVARGDNWDDTTKKVINPSLRDAFLRTTVMSPSLGEHAADALFGSFVDVDDETERADGNENKNKSVLSPHLAHMAAHTYARLGRWRDAVDASVSAVNADKELTDKCVWPYGEAHNRVMLSHAAISLYGPSKNGESIAMAVSVDPGPPGKGHLDQFANFLTAFHDAHSILTAARFGRWRLVLKLAATYVLGLSLIPTLFGPITGDCLLRPRYERLTLFFPNHRAERNAVNENATLRPSDSGAPLSAETWTNLVSSTVFGRAQWAYVMGLASSAGFTDSARSYKSEEDQGKDINTREQAYEPWIDGSFCAKISPTAWLAHVNDLTRDASLADHDDEFVVEGVSTRGGKGPFHETSPFKPNKKRLALIALYTLGAAIAGRSGDWESAVVQLELAKSVHSTLPYMEPEHWYLPPQLCLGEALLRSGRPEEALVVFRIELRDARPHDAWALQGERRALRRMESERGGGGGGDTNKNLAKDVGTACFEVFP